MQVSIAFAEAHAGKRSYPYETDASIRHEVFTRRGGMYFGIAHLLDYQTSYDKKVFRFADYNAGHYASRNAAFQNAVSVATGIPLDLDGDLIRYKKDKSKGKLSETESAVRNLATQLGMSDEAIHGSLLLSGQQSFEDSELYARVFAMPDKPRGKPLPRAKLPRIRLNSPKITRKLTTEWFAKRVNQRYQKCMSRAKGRKGSCITLLNNFRRWHYFHHPHHQDWHALTNPFPCRHPLQQRHRIYRRHERRHGTACYQHKCSSLNATHNGHKVLADFIFIDLCSA